MIGGRVSAVAMSPTKQRMIAMLVALSFLSISFFLISDDYGYGDGLNPPSGEDYRSLLQTPHMDEVPIIQPSTEPLLAIQPYSLQNVLQTVPYFQDTFSVLVYDPPSDKFIMYYSKKMKWKSSCYKLARSFKWLVQSLRTLNPERFNPNNNVSEFAVAVSSGDYPHVKYTDCIRKERTDCISSDLSPILQFGSAFQRPIFPTLIAMPMPVPSHEECYNTWAKFGKVCASYLPKSRKNKKGLVLPEHVGLQYDELIPQVVWRGTAFSYLSHMRGFRRPNFDKDVASQIDKQLAVDEKTKVAATHAMQKIYDDLGEYSGGGLVQL